MAKTICGLKYSSVAFTLPLLGSIYTRGVSRVSKVSIPLEISLPQPPPPPCNWSQHMLEPRSIKSYCLASFTVCNRSVPMSMSKCQCKCECDEVLGLGLGFAGRSRLPTTWRTSSYVGVLAPGSLHSDRPVRLQLEWIIICSRRDPLSVFTFNQVNHTRMQTIISTLIISRIKTYNLF